MTNYEKMLDEMADRVGWKNTKNSRGPNNSKIWEGMAEEVIFAAERLKLAQIECRPAVELIKSYNFSDCLIYADPPYLFETRGSRLYREEMGKEAEHVELLDALCAHKGKVILSGYDSELYNNRLSGWHKETMYGFDGVGKRRNELLWMNFEPAGQMRL